MKKERAFFVTLMMVASWLTPCLVIAQQDSIKTLRLDEIVITATKFPKSSSETGKVLTIIDFEQLQRGEGKDLAQLLNEQVGLIVNGANSNPGKDKSVYLRGAKSDYTIFLIDGIPVSDPSGPGGAFDPRMLSLNQLERIEILKGSQSTLYGSDAIAGVINLITKKRGDSDIGGSGSISYGSNELIKGSGTISGNTKLADYNFGYNYTKSGGISEAKDIGGNNNFDIDGFHQSSFNASVGFKINANMSFSPFIRYTDYDGMFDGGSFSDDNSTFASTLLNPGFSSQYAFKKGTISLLYGHNKTERKFDGPFGPNQYNGSFNNIDAFINHEIAKQLRILAGLNYQNLNMTDGGLVIPNPEASILSPYISFFFHELKGLNLEVGGRFNSHSKYGSNGTYSFNPSYKIGSKTKIFINQSTGFKAPTLSQLYGSFGANENLKPEVSVSSEAGLQHLLTEKIDMRVVGFKRKVKDVIIYSFAGGNINLDEQNDEGIEFEASFQPNNKITVKANYTFVNGKVTTEENGQDSSYFNLFRRPKHSMGANVGIQITQKIYLGLNLKTFSKRQDLFFNPSNFFIAEIVTLDSYALIDAYFSYAMLDKRVNLFIDCKNLLNQVYTEVYGYNALRFNVNAGLGFSL